MIKGNQKLLNIFRILIDTAIIIFSFVIAYYLRFDEQHSILILLGWINAPIGIYGSLGSYSQMLFMLIPCYLASYYFFHLYDPARVKSRRFEFWGIIKANVVGILYCVAFLYFLNQRAYARLFIAIFVTMNFILELLFRLLTTTLLRRIRKKGMNQKHVLLVGYSRAAEGYIDRLLAHPEWGYYVHGILDNHKPIGHCYRDIPVVGRIDDLEKDTGRKDFDEIALPISLNHYDHLEEIVATTEKSRCPHQVYPGL